MVQLAFWARRVCSEKAVAIKAGRAMSTALDRKWVDLNGHGLSLVLPTSGQVRCPLLEALKSLCLSIHAWSI